MGRGSETPRVSLSFSQYSMYVSSGCHYIPRVQSLHIHPLGPDPGSTLGAVGIWRSPTEALIGEEEEDGSSDAFCRALQGSQSRLLGVRVDL